MTKEIQFQQLLEQFYSVVNRTNQLRNVPVRLEGCEALNLAAIHLIETIGAYEHINMTEISEKIGITKGAVSQMSAKLVSKGLVVKAKSPGSDKEINLSLSEGGQAVWKAHQKLHEQMYADLAGLLAEFSSTDLERVALFFAKLKTYMDEYAAHTS